MFHWGSGHEIAGGTQLWTGLGWALSMADVLVGLPMKNIQVPRDLTDSGVYAFVASNATLVTAYNPYRRADFSVSYTVEHDVSRYYRMGPDNSPYDLLLKESSCLGYTKYKDGLPYTIRDLLSPEGLKWFDQKSVWTKYAGYQNASFRANRQSMKKGDTLHMNQFNTYLLIQ